MAARAMHPAGKNLFPSGEEPRATSVTPMGGHGQPRSSVVDSGAGVMGDMVRIPMMWSCMWPWRRGLTSTCSRVPSAGAHSIQYARIRKQSVSVWITKQVLRMRNITSVRYVSPWKAFVDRVASGKRYFLLLPERRVFAVPHVKTAGSDVMQRCRPYAFPVHSPANPASLP